LLCMTKLVHRGDKKYRQRKFFHIRTYVLKMFSSSLVGGPTVSELCRDGQ
jgi:hypothetical protein